MTDEKHCASCGRPMLNDKRMDANPDRRYCSKKCSRDRLDKRYHYRMLQARVQSRIRL